MRALLLHHEGGDEAEDAEEEPDPEPPLLIPTLPFRYNRGEGAEADGVDQDVERDHLGIFCRRGCITPIIIQLSVL